MKLQPHQSFFCCVVMNFPQIARFAAGRKVCIDIILVTKIIIRKSEGPA